jgi:hypothetical protein
MRVTLSYLSVSVIESEPVPQPQARALLTIHLRYYQCICIVTVCVFVCHMFSFYPFYFDFHSARIIFRFLFMERDLLYLAITILVY